jgi:hypothetical protein
MIAAMVAGLIVLMLAVVIVWLSSPAFRRSVERPKYQMLERDADFERAAGRSLDPATTDPSKPTDLAP